MSAMLTREDFTKFDAQDVLADYRSQFRIAQDTIYLDGNSLGPMPVAVTERINHVLTREWSEDLIRSWNTNHWFELPYRIGDKIARLIGANPGEVVATDSVSVNLFKLVAAALHIQTDRHIIISEKGSFPTDVYIIQGLQSLLGDRFKLITVERDEISDAINEDTALVVLTDVHYKTGHLLDKKPITDLAHEKGALIIWDLCHSAAALPVDLNEINADLAVGCGYKYLNGGPGAPAFLFVAKRLQHSMQQPLCGWWGHARPFDFIDQYEPGTGIGSVKLVSHIFEGGSSVPS